MATYCLVPQDLASDVVNLLRRHFRDDPSMVVLVDRREQSPSANGSARVNRANGNAASRLGPGDTRDRRAATIEAETPPLPRRARRHAARLRFVKHAPSTDRQLEDEHATRLVIGAQAGDTDAFGELYALYFDRVHAYLRMALRDRDEADDLAQQVFLKALHRLETYEAAPHRSFRAWLFRIARNQLLDHLAKKSPALLQDPDRVTQEAATRAADIETFQSTMSWMSESEVAIFMRRLPVAQRQVATLRYVIGLSLDEIGDVLDRSAGSVRQLDYRARQELQRRLTALGRRPVVVRRRGLRGLRRPMYVLRERRFALWR